MLWGGACLPGLVLGYYGTASARGFAVSSSSVLFWTAVALLLGPVVGLAAGWTRHGGLLQAAALSGLVAATAAVVTLGMYLQG